MARGAGLWFAPLAGVILVIAIFALAFTVPGYDLVRQTASEIGEEGSPARWTFTAALFVVGASLVIFAISVLRAAPTTIRGMIAALLITAMAVSVAGVGYFAHPHPLHNTFGESQLIGYLAPLAVALGWRGRISAASWIAFTLLWASVAVNLGYIGLFGDAVRAEARDVLEPVYGLVQRSLFLIWFGWCALFAFMLMQEKRRVLSASKRRAQE